MTIDFDAKGKRRKRYTDRAESFETERTVWLSAPLTSTSWDGDSFSTTAKTLIDLSAVFGAPAGIRAVYVRLYVNDSGSAATPGLLLGLAPVDTAGLYMLSVMPSGLPNDYVAVEHGWVTCDANGDIYYQISASGAGTFDVVMRIWGYMW